MNADAQVFPVDWELNGRHNNELAENGIEHSYVLHGRRDALHLHRKMRKLKG